MDDEDSSSEHGDQSFFENVAPDDGPIDGDDAEEDNVSEVAIYVQLFLGKPRSLQLFILDFKLCRRRLMLAKSRTLAIYWTGNSLLRYAFCYLCVT
jgi:hypothetical protein